MPLFFIPFGIAACGNTAELEATIWALPAGAPLGTITASSSGEFVGLAYLLHVVFTPCTQEEATRRLTQELIRALTGLPAMDPDDAPAADK